MSKARSVFFVGVFGRAMGALAVDLADRGWRVRGSDRRAYPPMDERVARSKVEILDADDALPQDTDLVIVSGLRGRGYAHVEQALERGVPVRSFARFLEEEFLGNGGANLVVAGTNGKTTTSAMLVHILEQAGVDPDYLVGGTIQGRDVMARFKGTGPTVLEGDEFPAGFGDRNPKMLYYHPRVLGVTNMAFDHPEAYRDEREYKQAFVYLLQQVPRNGSVILSADDAGLSLLAERSPAPVTTVGFKEGADFQITAYSTDADGAHFDFAERHWTLPSPGKMNARNAAMAAVMAHRAGVGFDQSTAAIATFPGVACRQEVLLDSPQVTVLQDEAYHPDSLRALVETLRECFAGRRLVMLLSLRFTGGADQYQQAQLPEALAGVGELLWSPPLNFRTYSDQAFDEKRFAKELEAVGVHAQRLESLDQAPAAARAVVKAGDVLVLSLGSDNADVVSEVVKTVGEAS